jgi:hypothetical protein
LDVALDRVGSEGVQNRWTRPIAWWYWSRISPLDLMPAGHETMYGSLVPPLNSQRFHILKGVLNAIAQPFG